MSKRIYLDIETLPPEESVREKLARELYIERGFGELGVNEAEIEAEAEDQYRDLALEGEWGWLLCVGLVTMWEWTKWRRRISLHDMAQTLGIPSPKESGMNGLSIYDLYQQGRHEEIAQYCMRDVKCAREAFYRCDLKDRMAVTF